MTDRELQQRTQAFVRAFGLLDQTHTPCGQPMPVSHGHALQALLTAPGLTQQGLAGLLHLDKSTTSRLVTHLVDQGWVERAENPQNRREVRLDLTPRGREAAEQVSAAAADRYRSLWERLPAAKRAQVLESLALLTDALKGGQEP